MRGPNTRLTDACRQAFAVERPPELQRHVALGSLTKEPPRQRQRGTGRGKPSRHVEVFEFVARHVFYGP